MLDITGDGTRFALVGREKELNLVLDACRALAGFSPAGSFDHPRLIFFSGWRGMGKTRLLQELAMQTKTDNRITLVVSSERSRDVWADLEAFFKTFAAQLNEFYPLEAFNRLIGNRNLRQDQDGMSLRANTLITDLLRLQKTYNFAIVLLHDDVSSKAFQWLGKFFYKRLFDNKMLCVVATGATAPTISSLSLTPYFYSDSLKPLSLEQTTALLAPFSFNSHISQDLVKYSAGNPGCLNEGLRRLNANYEGSLAQAMAEYLLEGLPDPLAQCCLYLAPLRWFNHDIMSLLLPEVLPEESPIRQYGAADFLRLGRELNDKVDFIETGQNYFMQPAARQILSYALTYCSVENSALKPLPHIHQKAADYYRDLITRLKPEQRPMIALEHIYHTIQYKLTMNDNAYLSLSYFDYLKTLIGEGSLYNQLVDLVRQEPDLSPYISS